MRGSSFDRPFFKKNDYFFKECFGQNVGDFEIPTFGGSRFVLAAQRDDRAARGGLLSAPFPARELGSYRAAIVIYMRLWKVKPDAG